MSQNPEQIRVGSSTESQRKRVKMQRDIEQKLDALDEAMQALRQATNEDEALARTTCERSRAVLYLIDYALDDPDTWTKPLVDRAKRLLQEAAELLQGTIFEVRNVGRAPDFVKAVRLAQAEYQVWRGSDSTPLIRKEPQPQ